MLIEPHALLAELIQYPSITPQDAGCQAKMIEWLEALGFHCQRFDQSPVTNFYAQIGSSAPLLIFAGHTDVVPPGNLEQWHSNPFQLHEYQDYLYGRGVADMKGALACMLAAVATYTQKNNDFSGSIGFLITSGEEGDDYLAGTPYVMEQLKANHVHPDYCIVGEPSSHRRVGDTIKIGRRGSLTGHLILSGKQGHVAYPHLADNPIHKIAPILAELTSRVWDEGNTYFPPTTLQITHIHAGGEANNIIPGKVALDFNFRYSTEQTAEKLQKAVEDCFSQYKITPEIHWQHSGKPFLTSQGRLLDTCIYVIQQYLGETPELSTSGGTSDGRFIAPYGVEVIELGLMNATIHQTNEQIHKSDLTDLTHLYYGICKKIFE